MTSSVDNTNSRPAPLDPWHLTGQDNSHDTFHGNTRPIAHSYKWVYTLYIQLCLWKLKPPPPTHTHTFHYTLSDIVHNNKFVNINTSVTSIWLMAECIW